jgi:hypothetical protein
MISSAIVRLNYFLVIELTWDADALWLNAQFFEFFQ